MKLSQINQIVPQALNHGSAQLTLVSQHIKSVSPRAFSQKLYQFDEIEIAEEYEQAIDANSLEKINILLAKLV